jgi:hypothetical protein
MMKYVLCNFEKIIIGHWLWGQGKSTYKFSAQRLQVSAFRLLALTTVAWRGAESGTLREPYTLIYPDPWLRISHQT